MRIPTIDEFRPIVLRVLADGQARTVKSVCEEAARLAGLDDEAKEERLISGERRYSNRVQWACTGLCAAGLLVRPKRGVCQITPNGLDVASRGLVTYTEKDMLEWEAWRTYLQELAERRASQSTDGGTDAVDADVMTQDGAEKIDELAASFNADVETALRRRLQEASPEFFEKAVVDLLWAMGYGGAHGDKQRVGQSGDGGIDGVIRQDPLGLTTVYVQAKRYADTNTVGTPQIRDFMGALDSRGATLGVFITTSRFQPKAIEIAGAYRHGTIVLIDGVKLTSLMLDYGVAVEKHKVVTLYSIDEDFFETDD